LLNLQPQHNSIALEVVFTEKYWFLIVAGAVILSAGIVLLLYYRHRDGAELTVIQRNILATLRFLAVFTIILLLSGPLVKTLRKIIREPVIIIAVDNSISMKGNENNEEKNIGIINRIEELRSSLSGRFFLHEYTFGESVRKLSVPEFDEKSSGYAQVIESAFNNHFNDNVGAMILIGDGIYNQGENPLNTARKLSFPVYTIALGDTTAFRDLRIADIRHNRNAFLGNQFPVEIDIQYQGIDKAHFRFAILYNDDIVFSENIYTSGPDGFQTINALLNTEKKGLQYYTAKIDADRDEINTVNNSQRFAINVIENKQKVMILANGSHPDAGALKEALESQVNYEVSLFTTEPYPTDHSQYNLVVLSQIPSSSKSGREIFASRSVSRLPVLVMIGSQTMIQQLNIAGLGIGITLQAGNFEDAQPIINEHFNSFTLSPALRESMSRYPPVKVPFATYSLDPAWQVIAYQRIRNIETDRPLIAVGSQNGQKTGVIFGEGLWRWRMYDYLLNDNHIQFNELMDKLVQYLATRDNEDNFMINFRPVYYETEPVNMQAEVYNESYEPITSPEVRMVLKDSLNREFSYVFDKGSQFYRLEIGMLPPGEYTFTARAEVGTNLHTETGTFVVMPVNIELMNTQANHRMLFQLASQTGGEFYTAEGLQDLTADILGNTGIKPYSYYQALLNEVLNLRWIFFMILTILSVEWFLRKFWGIY
jgi:hypothetical protein